MSGRELLILGTASQVPTRTRAHHAALLRFDGHGILLDPGEGTQRQLSLARVAVSTIQRICITHAHGDHCLGLPGVLQRLALDGIEDPVVLHYPKEAARYITALRNASASSTGAEVEERPASPGVLSTEPPLTVEARALSHVIPTLGYRFSQPDGRHLLPERLEALGIPDEARSDLVETGSVRVGGRRVQLEEVSTARPGVHLAHVMDTRDCPGARELAEAVDLLLIEATFLSTEQDLAEAAGHLTAAQAARIGHEAGARRVVLTHLSRRYPGTAAHLAEARAAAPGLDVHVAQDLE
ncbi:MAG: MBL fold metallo-hydrolase, partial [Nitriliruptoraceae bacterium]